MIEIIAVSLSLLFANKILQYFELLLANIEISVYC